ncbi:MAG: hypothetical protein K2X50_07030 [Gammaproteobacteria bacterium]|nr:hypothetical protein [Gammaproteobacteria bacterium]
MQGKQSESEQHNSSSLAELNRFEEKVRNAVFKDIKEFKQLLYHCLHFELTANQTSRMLVVCRSYERMHIKVPLRLCRNRKEIAVPQTYTGTLGETAKVATLLGVVQYLGAGIQQDDARAKHYFELAVSLSQKDAWLFLGIMARKGHGQHEGKPNFSFAWDCFEKALIDDYNPEAHFQQVEMFLNNEVSKARLKSTRHSGYSAVKGILLKGFEESDSLGINLGLKRQIDIKKLITAIELLEAELNSNNGEDDSATKSLFDNKYQEVKTTQIKIDVKGVAVLGDPFGLVNVAEKRIKALAPDNDNIKIAAQLLHRAYLTCHRLRKEHLCDVIKAQFYNLMSNSAIQKNDHYGFILYYYGVAISPDFLKEQSAEIGFDALIRFYLLHDHFTARRVRMQWVLSLVDSKIPEQFSLLGKSLRRREELKCFLYELGKLAIEAMDDSLELADQLEGSEKDKVIVEAKSFWQFADDIRVELQLGESQAPKKQGSSAEKDKKDQVSDQIGPFHSQKLLLYYRGILQPRINSLLQRIINAPVCYSGFSTVLQFFMGSVSGSHQLELPQNAELAYYLYRTLQQCELFHIIQEKQTVSGYQRQKLIYYLVVLSAVPDEARNESIQSEITSLCNDINSVSLQPYSVFTILKGVLNCRDDFLKKLQEFYDFCRLKEYSYAHSLVQQSDQFIIFRENRLFIDAISNAIKEFESFENQPSQINFFSSTYGLDSEYADEVSKAKDLLRRCELSIFSKVRMAREIFEFIDKRPANVFSAKFLEIFIGILVTQLNYPVKLKSLTLDNALSVFRSLFEADQLPSDINSVSDFSL